MPLDINSMYGGLRVVTDRFLTETETVRNFPKDRFIEYGPEDDAHGRFMGWVYDRTVPSKTVYRIGDTIVMHPDIFTLIKK